jgi:hypothetical protein
MTSRKPQGSIRLDPVQKLWIAHCVPCNTKYRADFSPLVFTWAAIHLRRHEQGAIQ